MVKNLGQYGAENQKKCQNDSIGIYFEKPIGKCKKDNRDRGVDHEHHRYGFCAISLEKCRVDKIPEQSGHKKKRKTDQGNP